MGAVYEGVHQETGETAAIKSLAPGLARESDFRQRFEVEIETLRKLRHPNIVRLFAFGEQDGLLYYAMELVNGRSLEDELHEGRRFDWREVSVIGIQMCHALRHAHDRGIIHRDIKPANLLMTPEGQVKLSDFGIARLFGNTQLTMAGSVLGTVEYMAPEQADARPVGPRSDLYSLGGVLFALLAGRAPFKARSLPEMLDLQRTAKPDPVSRYAFGVPQELERIIAELLEKDPEKRVANAMILGRRLQAMLHGLALSQGTQSGSASVPREADFEIEPPAREPDQTEIIGMPPTRALEPDAKAPNLSFQISAPAGSLPETRETSAFQAYAGEPPSATAVPRKTEVRPAQDRFVVVPEEELDRHEAESEHRPLVSIQTGILAGALIILGLTAWYLLQPSSADTLYQRITAAAADNTIDSLTTVRSEIKDFLTRYSDDPRTGKIREYAEELELADLQGEFYRRSLGIRNSGELLPIERAYQEAYNCSRVDPDLGVVKLQALLDLYDNHGDRTGPRGKCLELARRQLERLQKQLAEPAQQHLHMLEERLHQAEELRTTDPEQARRMWQAVVELYAAKPWAAAAVQEAREALATLKPSEPSAAAPEQTAPK